MILDRKHFLMSIHIGCSFDLSASYLVSTFVREFGLKPWRREMAAVRSRRTPECPRCPPAAPHCKPRPRRGSHVHLHGSDGRPVPKQKTCRGLYGMKAFQGHEQCSADEQCCAALCLSRRRPVSRVGRLCSSAFLQPVSRAWPPPVTSARHAAYVCTLYGLYPAAADSRPAERCSELRRWLVLLLLLLLHLSTAEGRSWPRDRCERTDDARDGVTIRLSYCPHLICDYIRPTGALLH